MVMNILATVVALSSHLSLTDVTGMSGNKEMKLLSTKCVYKARAESSLVLNSRQSFLDLFMCLRELSDLLCIFSCSRLDTVVGDEEFYLNKKLIYEHTKHLN